MTTGYGAEVEADPSVCYRHPDRQSWILCQRCGRTICPECQILAPVGVQCPDCVREAGGSVKWTPTGGSRGSAAASTRRSSAPRWVRSIGRMLRPESGAPVLSWGLAAAAILLWVVGIFTSDVFTLLVAAPYPLQPWRFVTGMVTYAPGLSFRGLVSLALSMVFWLLNAPRAETSMGTARFATVVLAAGIVGNAAQVIFGSSGYGLFGALFGIFAAYLIEVWEYAQVRFQVLLMFGINIVLVIALSPALLPEIVIGALAGAGAFWVLERLPSRMRLRGRQPHLIVWGGVLVIVVIASVVTLAR